MSPLAPKSLVPIVGCFALALLAPPGAAHATAPPARVVHVPPAEARSGLPLVLEADIDRAWEEELQLSFRRLGDDGFRTEPFRRGVREGRYVATIPAAEIRPPGIEYFLVGRDRSGESHAHFASAAAPHRVAVHAAAADRLRQAELDEVHGRKAGFRVSFEHINFGSRTVGREHVRDDHYRLEADFTYRLLKLPLRSIAFGFTRFVGQTLEKPRADASGECVEEPDPDCRMRAGIPGGGWFGMSFRLGSLLDLDGRVILTATKDAFAVGGRAELRAGAPTGSHVAVGAEGIAATGFAAWFRLGWDTVPRFPMAATIELTDYPASHLATAVRLMVDVVHPMDNGLKLGLRTGYQARDGDPGGVTLGASTSLDF